MYFVYDIYSSPIMTASKKHVRRSNRKSRCSHKKRGGSKHRKRGGENEESSKISTLTSKATEISPVEIREPESESPESVISPELEESIVSEGNEEMESEEEPKKAGLLAGFTHFFSWITGKSDSKTADDEAESSENEESNESEEVEEPNESESEEKSEEESKEESEETSPLDTINISPEEVDDSLTTKPSLPIPPSPLSSTKTAMGGKRAKRKKNKTRKVRNSRRKHVKGGSSNKSKK